VPAEVLDRKQTAALDPGVHMEVAGSVYFPKDCHLVPDQFLAALKSELGARGARLLWDTALQGFVPKPGNGSGRGRIAAIRTRENEIAADEFVICGGSWSSNVARELGLRIPLQAGKGYSLTIPHPRELPTICSILAEARVAVTPMNGSLRFGGTMEIAGLNEAINHRRVQGIINAAAKYYPAFVPDAFEGIEPWSGLRPCSPDGLPYLGRTQRWANVSVATGHGMTGLSLAPITGKLMSQILDDERPAIDIALLDPDRYARR
jgi:D-amino-acid dehydrogenase